MSNRFHIIILFYSLKIKYHANIKNARVIYLQHVGVHVHDLQPEQSQEHPEHVRNAHHVRGGHSAHRAHDLYISI